MEIKKQRYGKYEYCKAINCHFLPNLKMGDKCEECGAYKFHKYLDANGYEIVKGSA